MKFQYTNIEFITTVEGGFHTESLRRLLGVAFSYLKNVRLFYAHIKKIVE